ncbi:MAG: glycosyltransferase family 4 protein, partial [Bacteroidia bacterium]|nr:glycosyltransferase family 4 protein [Bacteroidia bacterium]
ESHVLDLVANLDPEKVESLVLSFTPGAMVDRLNERGIKTFVIPTKFPFDVRVWGQVKHLMHDHRIDLVHAHGTRALSNVFHGAKKNRLPLLYTVHGWSFNNDQQGWKRRLRVAGESYLVRKADQTINISESNRQVGIDNIKGFSSVVVRCGIDLNKFNKDAPHDNIRMQLGVRPDETLVGYIVRITRQKDPVSMIKAFALVAEQEPDIRLLVVGDGDLKQEVVDLIASLGLRDRVIVQGFRQDIPNVLSNIDIYCLPSLWEGLPLGLLEAMAMGKAIVASAVDGTLEVVKEGDNGLLITPGNVEAIVRSNPPNSPEQKH